MLASDVEGVRLVSRAAFGQLEADHHTPSVPSQPPRRARLRLEHLIDTDPDGCWVADRGGEITGAAVGIMREGIWGLSLLVVDPAQQSAGVGGALLARAVEHGRQARGRIILSSVDPRAVSAYLGLGLALAPAAAASGRASQLSLSGEVRPGRASDAGLLAAVDREVRAAAHGSDVDAMVAGGDRLLVFDGRGYALVSDHAVSLLAARDERAAAELLRAALAAGEDLQVQWLTAHQPWAVEVCRQAGLRFHLGWGAVLTDGELGPMAPYLPSGAYL